MAKLQAEIGDDADQVGIAAALADAVDRPLDLRRATSHCGECVGDGDVAIVVAVDAQLGAESAAHSLDALGDLLGQRAAVGVAEDDDRGAGILGGVERLQGVLRVVLVAVEEVFGVVEDLAAGGAAERDRVGDHAQVLFEGGADHLADVHVPGLADDGDDGRLRIEQGLEARVVLGPGVLAPRHAKGGDSRVPQRELLDLLKILEVLGVGERVTALDEVNAEFIEAARDEQLVLEREVDALALAAVAKGGVVDRDARHGVPANEKSPEATPQG